MTFSVPFEPFPPDEPGVAGKDPLLRHAFRGAITAADAYRAVRQALRVDRDAFRVGNRFYPKDRFREIAFVALGNASASMSLATVHALGDRVTQGFVVGPEEPPAEVPFRFQKSGGVAFGSSEARSGCGAVQELAGGLGSRDLLVVLLSAGALEVLALPPEGTDGTSWSGWLNGLLQSGSTGAEVALLARLFGSGAVAGRLARAAGDATVATLIVERGDGPSRLGGGPTCPPTESEREEARAVLDRLGLSSRLSSNERALLVEDPTRSHPLPPNVHRPVVIAQPGDALRGAAEAIAERKWFPRRGILPAGEGPEAAANTFLDRVEQEIGRAGDVRATGDRRRLAVLATTTLGLPEGVDERNGFGRFLRTAADRVRRRGTVIGLLRTAGAPKDALGAPGRLVAAATGSTTASQPFQYRSISMRSGITDVGCLAVALVPFEGTS